MSEVPTSPTHKTRSLSIQAICSAAALGFLFALGVFIASVLGNYTRPVGQYATFWPVNALLLATVVRWPQLCQPASWLGACAGYLLAESRMGSDLITSFWFMLANLAGVGVGAMLFFSMSRRDQLLQRPVSMLFLLVIATSCSIASAVVGGGNALLSVGTGWLLSFSNWATTEFVHYLLILSMVLTTPTPTELRAGLSSIWKQTQTNPFFHAPLVALMGAAYITVKIGGPGAIVFVVPALLWCSLTYPRFTTAIITMCTLAWLMMVGSFEIMKNAAISPNIVHETMSLHLGVSLMALVPLMVSSVEQSRRQLIARLSHAVQYDFLTGAFARKYFLETSSRLLSEEIAPNAPMPVACLMIDIDHFKSINDNFGHAGGDDVLRGFSEVIRKLLRRSDLFGRLGGEEFAIVMKEAPPEVASAVAERIRERVEETPVILPDGQQVNMTVSVGVACCLANQVTSIESMLQVADQALYRAKASGRNRVQLTVTFEGDHRHVRQLTRT